MSRPIRTLPTRSSKASLLAPGAHPYNLSLMASVIAHDGEAKAEELARGMVANFARAPKGGDTDQIKATFRRASVALQFPTLTMSPA